MQVEYHPAALAERLSAFIRSSPGPSPRIGSLVGEESFNRLALDVFAFQHKHNPAYRRFCEGRRTAPQTVHHWSQIPAVPTAAFKEQELSCLPQNDRTVVFHSSGTTEHRPSRHYHNEQSLAVYEASLWRWFAANVPGNLSRQRFLALTPPPEAAPHSSLVHMFGVIHRQLGLPGPGFLAQVSAGNGWDLDHAQVIDALNSATFRKEPLLILGTAFSFVHLLDQLAQNGRRFAVPTGSRALETGGYKGRSRALPKAQLHNEITQRLGISGDAIVSEYGMSELSSQAYARGCGQEPFAFPPWARAQVVSPETGREVEEGETGLLRVFDLANVYSVMAIQTEDLAIRRGAGFELIGRAALAESRGCSLMPVG